MIESLIKYIKTRWMDTCMNYKQSLPTGSLVFSIAYIEIMSMTKLIKRTLKFSVVKSFGTSFRNLRRKTEQQMNVGVVCNNFTQRGKIK